jgi:hypothetical protein
MRIVSRTIESNESQPNNIHEKPTKNVRAAENCALLARRPYFLKDRHSTRYSRYERNGQSVHYVR